MHSSAGQQHEIKLLGPEESPPATQPESSSSPMNRKGHGRGHEPSAWVSLESRTCSSLGKIRGEPAVWEVEKRQWMSEAVTHSLKAMERTETVLEGRRVRMWRGAMGGAHERVFPGLRSMGSSMVGDRKALEATEEGQA